MRQTILFGGQVPGVEKPSDLSRRDKVIDFIVETGGLAVDQQQRSA